MESKYFKKGINNYHETEGNPINPQDEYPVQDDFLFSYPMEGAVLS